MKVHVTRLISGCLVAALLFLFTSCQKDAPTSGSTAPTQTLGTQSPPESTIQPESTAAPAGTTSGKSATTVGAKPTQGKKLNASDIIALYNQSVRQARRSSYSRTMDTGRLWLSNNSEKSFDLAGDANVRKIFDSKDAGGSANTLPELSMSNVASAGCKDSGGKRILTIRLKAVTAAEDVAQKASSYPGLLGYEESVTMIKEIGKVFKLSGISVKSITYTLNNGVITATLSAADNTLQSVNLSYQQAMDLNLRFIAFQIQGKLISEIKASYRL